MLSSTAQTVPPHASNGYPTTDPHAMPGTDRHNHVIALILGTLLWWFRDQPVYVSGELLVFYQRGNRRRHVSPDVFVVKGVANVERDNYLTWQEGPPHGIIEVTSPSTYQDDMGPKLQLYRDVLRVKEYFLFDPRRECLDPPLQGYRLRGRRYVRIREVDGRLPSQVLGLHLERNGTDLRFYDPATVLWVPTAEERLRAATAELERGAAREAERTRAHAAELTREREARLTAEAELEHLRRALAERPAQR